MLRRFHAAVGLQVNLLAVIEGPATPTQLSELIRTVHAVALQILRNRRSAGLAQVLQGITDSDLAFDCIADLFRKDEHGNYVGLKAYFSSLDLGNADNEEVLVYLRRLVASAVNQGLFRVFNEADPALGRILRNIRLSIQALRNYEELEVFGEICISPILCDPIDHLPACDRFQITARLAEISTGSEKIPELLANLSTVLRHQHEFSRIVPLVAAGLAFRDLYAQKSAGAGGEAVYEQPPMTEDLAGDIERACRQVKARLGDKYVRRGKISDQLFDTYFAAIVKYLKSKTNGDGADLPLFDSLRGILPELKHDEYRRKHRARLEYLARLVQERLARSLQK